MGALMTLVPKASTTPEGFTRIVNLNSYKTHKTHDSSSPKPNKTPRVIRARCLRGIWPHFAIRAELGMHTVDVVLRDSPRTLNSEP